MMSKIDQLMLELFEDAGAAAAADLPFVDYQDWDSLKHVELIVGIESRFGVELTAKEIECLTCKRAIRETLAAKHVDV